MKKILILASTLGALTASTAGASHPRIDQMETVKIIAHDLERKTAYLYQAAEHDRHHYDRYERRALNELHALKRSARNFHLQVERYVRDPYHTEARYRSLLRAFGGAADGVRYLHERRHVKQGFYDVERLIGSLSNYYTGYRYDRGRHYRYDRGRHHRYERRGHHHGGYRYPHGKVQVYLPHIDLRWRW